MWPKEYLVIAFIAVVVLYFIAKFVTEKAMAKKLEDQFSVAPKFVSESTHKEVKHTTEDCAEGGCGMRAICNGKEEVAFDYYEDEELDVFKGRLADDYTADEVNEFREVLTTLRGGEVAPWLNSLCARGISLPSSLRNQAIVLAKNNK